MTVRRLRVENVRCLGGVEMELADEANFIHGPNGAGKTSLLEAIYLLGRGRSFRTRRLARLVRRGERGLTVYGEIAEAGALRRVGVAFSEGTLEARIDGAAADGLAGLARVFPVHVIDPKLHRLIEAGPSERRRYLDAGVFHVEQDYLQRWRAYRRLLGQRNAALKAGARGAELEAWTEPFVAAGVDVHRARGRYVAALDERLRNLGRRLVGSDLVVDYRSGWRRGLDLAEAVSEARERDRMTGYSQVGPHRADLRVGFEAGQVRDAASRGQQKLAAAALVIGQVGLFEAATGRRGTLLVDDPAAELDPRSLEALLQAIGELEAQRILTGLDLAGLRPAAGSPVFHVKQGQVEAVL